MRYSAKEKVGCLKKPQKSQDAKNPEHAEQFEYSYMPRTDKQLEKRREDSKKSMML